MSTIRVGNAPCSWGSLEFDGLSGEAIGYLQMLDELAATGYVGTELGDWGYMPTDAKQLAKELSNRALTLVGAFVPVKLVNPEAHAEGIQAALKIARLMADTCSRISAGTLPFLVLADDNGTVPVRTQQAGRVTSDLMLSEAQWNHYARGANQVAATVKRETGLPTVFHHHCAGYVETPEEIGRLLERTDPELLGLVFDTGHFAYGTGANDAATVTAALEQFADRIWYMHFKDCEPRIAEQARREQWDYFAAIKQGVFCELGQGFVDFPEVLSWLKKRDYQGWVLVEQDVLPGLGRPRESAQRNRDYLRSLGI